MRAAHERHETLKWIKTGAATHQAAPARKPLLSGLRA
jgi:hypothetical protein